MKLNSIRNSEGIWINTQVFREEGLHFKKHNYYCADPYDSPAWYDYWMEQRRRCIYGYEVGGAKITGEYYFYLNFCPIQKVENTSSNKSKKIKSFPDFWDSDYNYFWSREIARNGVLDILKRDEDKDEILNLPSIEQIPHLKRLYDSLGLEVKIPTHTIIGSDNNKRIKHHLKGGYNLIVGKSRRRGFEQPYSEPIITPKGETTMGKISVGDIISTPTGNAKVIEKFEQGVKDVYQITLKDGRKVRCGKNHLWKIIDGRNNEKIVKTEFFLDKKLKRGSKSKESYAYHLPQTKEVEYITKGKLPIHPYLLGLLIGDGSMNRNTCLFSTIDLEILEYIKDILGEDYKINKATDTQYRIVYPKISTKNPLMYEIRKLSLNCTASYKFIPDIYKYSSVEDRYELVKGLMDTDGSVWKTGSCNFVNTSERLIDDLAYVLRSLGIRVIKTKYDNVGKGFSKKQAWTLIITTDKKIFKLKRKNDRIRKRKYDIDKVAITKVEKLDYKENSACILIDTKEQLYLTKDFIVTHNSYKNSSISACNFFTKPNSLTIQNAYEKKYLYPRGIFTMTLDYINFINENTAWIMPSDSVNKMDHIRGSYIQYKDGVKIEKGFMSEIMALTCKDNADVNRGKDAVDIMIEEAGAFGTPGLLKSTYKASEDCVMAGAIKTGLITIFGTSGDMESGTADYADMYTRPLAFGLLPFNNIWDKDSEQNYVGFFHPINWNMEGFYDSNGNSDKEAARQLELEIRENLIKNGATSTEIQQRMQEKPLNPSEAFGIVSVNNFPVIELKQQLQKVKANDWQNTKGTPVDMYYNEGKVVAKPILDLSKTPITSFFNVPANKKGCPIIYEYPVPDTPRGLYKIGYDPVRQDIGTSLAAIIVYKGVHVNTQYHDIIVAEYIGRLELAEDIDRIAEMFADFYNAKIMHENEVTGVKNFFRRIKRLGLLACQPDLVISKSIKKSKVSRIYGCHMTQQLKDAGERYVKEWLLTILDYDENGDKIRVIDRIYSIRLLEELISYNRKGNFDLISALFMCMFQVQEEELGKEYNEKDEHKNTKKLLSMIQNMYKKN